MTKKPAGILLRRVHRKARATAAALTGFCAPAFRALAFSAAAFCALAAGVPQASAQSSAPAAGRRYPVTTENVVAAMRQRSLPADGVQIRMPAAVTAAVANPALEIRAINVGDSRSAQLLVGCRAASDCIPFYVSASWTAPVTLSSQLSTGSAAKAAPASGQRLSKASLPEDTDALRAGASAVLLLEGDRVHVRLRVVCLEAGAPGDKVRVATPDHRQAYVAEVLGQGLLKGSL
jgi:hypothetical protein